MRSACLRSDALSVHGGYEPARALEASFPRRLPSFSGVHFSGSLSSIRAPERMSCQISSIVPMNSLSRRRNGGFRFVDLSTSR